MENHGIKVIHLTGVEKQSGYDRLTFAEDLIRQLPETMKEETPGYSTIVTVKTLIRCVLIEALSGMCTIKPLKQLSNAQHSKEMNKKIVVELTTFCGRCIEAIHYYVSVEYYDSCDDFRRDKLKRPITQKEIDSNGDRFYSYEAGEPTECFNSWREALESAQEYIASNDLEGDIYVYGVPNKGALTLEQALDPELDTRKRCSKCGKVFGDREGFYNFPEGALCVQCHKK